MTSSIPVRFCEYCEEIFFFKKNKFCSEECRWTANAERRKKDRRPSLKRKRNIEDVKWSKAVRERAEGFCEECGQEAVDAHHIVPIDIGGERLDLENGMALCSSCHSEKHPELPKELFFNRFGDKNEEISDSD